MKPYLLMEPLTIELPAWRPSAQTFCLLWASLSWSSEWESAGLLWTFYNSFILCSTVFPNAQILHYLRYILPPRPHPFVSLSLSSIYGIGGYWLSLGEGGGRKLATGRVYSPVYKKLKYSYHCFERNSLCPNNIFQTSSVLSCQQNWL